MDVADVASPDFDRDPQPNGHPQPADEAVGLNELLSQLILESSKHVLLVGHSSGAFIATMVAAPELQARTRKAKGASGGIVGIFCYAGFLIPVGQSVHFFFQPKDGSGAGYPPYNQFHVNLHNPLIYDYESYLLAPPDSSSTH